MADQTDFLVIGAGPAGLAAACSARKCGLSVALVDEQEALGGQLFRNIETPLGQSVLEAKECQQGLTLVNEFRKSSVMYHPKTTVWGVEPHKVTCTVNGRGKAFNTLSVAIAPGAMERPVPFPGWTLPGVIGAGGADIILRSKGTLTKKSNDPVVLAGNGPLLLLLACHLLEAGVHIAAWLDTGFWSKRIMATGLMPLSPLDSPYVKKGMTMALKIIKSRVKIYTGVTDIRAIGDGHVEKISFQTGNKYNEIRTHVLIRHEGIIPRTHILNSLKANHKWDFVQRYWYPDVNEAGATSIDGIYTTGDAAYVHGGDVSVLKGKLTGIDAARRLGVISAGEAAYRSKEPLRKLRTIKTARAFLKYVFAPNPNIFTVPDDTIVCRCESVTAGSIRKSVREGNSNINEVKLYTRCGMGLCQGRMCGPGLAEITAAELSKSPKDVGMLQVQQPFRPVSLGNYCNLHAPKQE